MHPCSSVSVEQLAVNQFVAGSSPAVGAITEEDAMKRRSVDTITITVTPGKGGLTAMHGATVKDGVEYMHRVFINGVNIWADGVSITDFELMLERPGDYWPFFCSYCGEPGCADIFYPVRCRHRNGQLVLVIREPLQDNCFSCRDHDDCSKRGTDAEYDCPQRRPHYHAYCIKKEQLRQQLSALRKDFGDRLDWC